MRIIFCTVVMLAAVEVVLGAPFSEDTKDKADLPQLPPGTIYSGPSNQTFILIRTNDENDLFQGDITGVKLVPLSEVGSVETRNAVRDPKKLWPGAQIPYIISEAFTDEQENIILRAIEEFSTQSCITWIPRDPEHHADYVEFFRASGEKCSSALGKTSGLQRIKLADGCFNQFGTSLHEMLHTVGFDHEQCRPDRDEFVEIIWENIKPGFEDQFVKQSTEGFTTFSMPYDYNSVMHYHPWAFSKNEGQTIVPKGNWSEDETLGQRQGFSTLDRLKINSLYKCPGKDEVQTNDCSDVYSDCITWSQTVDGCYRFQDFMDRYCPETCGVKRCQGKPEV